MPIYNPPNWMHPSSYEITADRLLTSFLFLLHDVSQLEFIAGNRYQVHPMNCLNLTQCAFDATEW